MIITIIFKRVLQVVVAFKAVFLIIGIINIKFPFNITKTSESRHGHNHGIIMRQRLCSEVLAKLSENNTGGLIRLRLVWGIL